MPTPVLLTSSGSGSISATYTTASYTPTQGSALFAAFSCARGAAAQTPTLSGNDATWTEVGRITFGATLYRTTLFRATGPAWSAGTLTATFANTHLNCCWSVFEVPTIDEVIAFATDSGSSTTPAVTLGAFSSADHITVGIFGLATSSSFTVGSGFTELSDTAVSSLTLAVEYVETSDTSVDGTWANDTAWGGFACQIGYKPGHGRSVGLGTRSISGAW